MRLLVLFGSFISICSCNGFSNNPIDVRIESATENQIKSLKVTFRNSSSKPFFFLHPFIYIKKLGCEEVYPLTGFLGTKRSISFCGNESAFPGGQSSISLEAHAEHVDSNNCNTLVSLAQNQWQSLIGRLCDSNSSDILFMKGYDSLTIKLQIIALPLGKYELFTSGIDLQDDRTLSRYAELKHELMRINKVNQFNYNSMDSYETRTAIGKINIDK